MRVISGTARGKKLLSPKDKKVRPTLDRVKENIFNILGNMRDAKVLDLFSGSGGIGIEALSRGASFCYFCDIDKDSIKLTMQNIKLARVEDRAKVVNDDAFSFLKIMDIKGEKFDFIFVDPPYLKGITEKILHQLQKCNIIQDRGIIIIETDKEEKFLDDEFGFKKLKEKVYSKTRVTFFTKEGI